MLAIHDGYRHYTQRISVRPAEWTDLVSGAARTQSIDLVEEDDAGGGVTPSLEHLTDCPLALSHVLGANDGW